MRIMHHMSQHIEVMDKMDFMDLTLESEYISLCVETLNRVGSHVHPDS